MAAGGGGRAGTITVGRDGGLGLEEQRSEQVSGEGACAWFGEKPWCPSFQHLAK